MTKRKRFDQFPRRGPNSRFIYGRIERGGSADHPIKGYLVEARLARRILARTSTDLSGRFLLELMEGDISVTDSLVVSARSPWGRLVAKRELVVSELNYPTALVFKSLGIPPRALKTGAGRSPKTKALTIERLEADGDWPVRVESSCLPVTLSWQVNLRETRFAESARIHLLADNNIMLRHINLQGTVNVQTEKSCEYTLVASVNAGRKTWRESRSIHVMRFRTLALFFEGPIETNSDILIGVRITCPAPARGVQVRIVSSNPEIIRATELFIKPGETSSLTRVRSGSNPGSVEVTALARGHLTDAVRLSVVGKRSSTEHMRPRSES